MSKPTFLLSAFCLLALSLLPLQAQVPAETQTAQRSTTMAQSTAAPLPANETILYQFGASSTDGQRPSTDLIQASDGNFYGGTFSGGTEGNGTLYRINPSNGQYSVLYNFTGGNDGEGPYNLIEAADGNLYGVTNYFGVDGNAVTGGTIFQYNLKTSTLTTVYSFQNGGVAGFGDLVDDGKGTLYGVASDDNPTGSNDGSVWSFNYLTNTFTTLHAFSVTDGFQPVGGLVLAADGNLYGTTEWGGMYISGSPDVGGTNVGYGTAFVMATNGANFHTFHNFDNGGQGVEDGFWPTGDLVQGPDGNIYGFTYEGGTLGNKTGVFFQIVPNGTNSTLHSIYEFQSGDGNMPLYGRPFLGGDGNFYITGSQGGANSEGQIMQITTMGSKADAYDFGTNPADGFFAQNQPFESTDGNLYGVAPDGGANFAGNIYELLTTLPPVITLTPSSTAVSAGGSLTLTWSVTNAFSTNAQICFANSSDNTWTGSVATSGSATITTTSTSGVVTYAITCGGVETATVQVAVGTVPPEITTGRLAGGIVRSPYSQTLATLGGTAPFTWSVPSGSLPPGLTLSGSTGVISGTPTQSGTFTFSIQLTDSESTPQTATASFSIVIVPAPLVPPTVSVTATPSSVAIGQSTTLTATVTGLANVPTPTGTVQFESNGISLGSPVALSASGVATLSGQSFSTTGSYGIIATYSGDGNYTVGNVATATVTVTSPVIPAVAATPNTVTITAPGGTGTTTLKAINFADSSVTFSCTGLPTGAGCAFSPLSSTGTSTLQITTAGANTSENLFYPAGNNGPHETYALAIPGLLALVGLFGRRRRHPQWRKLLMLMVLLSAGMTVTACSGGKSGNSNVNVTATSSGASTVTVMAVDGSQSATVNLTLTVQ
jgi:MYXO-CTERM domain-containing protein